MVYREIRVILSEYESGATYRINYFLRSQFDKAFYEEVYTVSHTVTLPERSGKQFDFISLGWLSSSGWRVVPEIRVNYYEVLYLLLDACNLEQKENGQWVESLDERYTLTLYLNTELLAEYK